MRRLDMRTGLESTNVIAGYARVPGPPVNGERDHRVDEPWAKRSRDSEREERSWKDQEQVDDPIDHQIGLAAQQARNQSDQGAHSERESDHGKRWQPRILNAEDDAR